MRLTCWQLLAMYVSLSCENVVMLCYIFSLEVARDRRRCHAHHCSCHWDGCYCYEVVELLCEPCTFVVVNGDS